WKCPICSSDKSHLIAVHEEKHPHHIELETKICPFCGQEILTPVSHEEKSHLESYLGPWRRESDNLEVHM
ncbi:hypothetical protein, partial [Salmonella enterica]|uniref:hypothetical protein n=1 Tax=Salmonella enterica TaxID=28901 RepID=UPI003CF1B980